MCEVLQKLYTTTLQRLKPFFKLLKETIKFYISNDLTTNFEKRNKLVLQSYQMALKQPLKDKQFFFMSNTSFTAAGHAIMIEDDPQQKLQSKRKTTYAPITFGSKTFYHIQLELSIYANEFLAIFFALSEFGHHIVCGDYFHSNRLH